MTFLPREFQVPASVETARFRLRSITIHDAFKDYDAVMSSREHLWTRFGEIWGWPTEDMTIEQNIVRDVLHADRYPEIRFVSGAARANGDELAITGTLALHGREREIVVSARRDGRGWMADARLHQPDFGIRPYSAMLGTLRVQADVSVRVVLPGAASTVPAP